jgi:hypothetical protein
METISANSPETICRTYEQAGRVSSNWSIMFQKLRPEELSNYSLPSSFALLGFSN